MIRRKSTGFCAIFGGIALAMGAPGPVADADVPAAEVDDAAAESPPEGTPSAGRSGLDSLLQLRGDGGSTPITIESDELELRALPDDARVVVFERNVHVRQGDVELRADLLEAFYPPEESEPSRLAARGHVRVDQPGQRAYCAEAEYLRDVDRLTCRGDARLERGCDVVRGDSIEFDLSADRARVIGAARVVLGSRRAGEGCSSGAPAGSDE